MVNNVLQTSLNAGTYQPGTIPVATSSSVTVLLGSPSTFSAQTCLTTSIFLPGDPPAQGGGQLQAYILRYVIRQGGGFKIVWTDPNQPPNQISNITNGFAVTFTLVVQPYEGLADLAAADSVGTIFIES